MKEEIEESIVPRMDGVRFRLRYPVADAKVAQDPRLQIGGADFEASTNCKLPQKLAILMIKERAQPRTANALCLIPEGLIDDRRKDKAPRRGNPPVVFSFQDQSVVCFDIDAKRIQCAC